MIVQKTSIITKQKIFLIISFVVLLLGFYSNFFGAAPKDAFGKFDEYSECLAIGKIARSDKEGVFSDGALPGVNYDASVVPANSDIWFEVYLQQRPEYIADQVPDSYDTYKSQTGGQLILYSIVQKILPFENGVRLKVFHFINAILSALCFTLLLGWVFRNFGLVSGVIVLFFIAMSSWITLFGNSLWWGLWSSYIPFVSMLLVLEYSHNKKRISANKILLYLFLSVFAKCIFNGYEFISTALVSAMCPIIFYAFLEREKLRSFIVFFIKASFTAILAVLTQMIILITQIRIVTGSFSEGINYIISSYLRRSFSAAGELASYSYPYIFKKYLKDSIFHWDFLSSYSSAFHFGYVILVIAILGVIVYYLSKNMDEVSRRLNLALLTITLISMIAPLSWFIVFKQHSANHFHLDYIVWYMPFLLFGFIIIGVGVSLILAKLGIYKGNKSLNQASRN